jgi:glycerol-3-phosphate acyltransferase PlsY
MGILLAAAIAYLLGCIPTGWIIVRLLRGVDVRAEGSGNIGATNVLRTTGRAAGLATLTVDVAKGALAVLAASFVAAGHPAAPAVAALAVVVGHAFPVTLGFRGGKGVSSAVGSALALAPLEAAGALAVLAAVVAAGRRVSAGSLAFAAILPLFVLIREGPWPRFPFLLASGALIVVRHRGNIGRLLAGTESRLGQG